MAVQLLGTPKIVDGKIHGTIQADTREEIVPNMKFGDDKIAFGCYAVTVDGGIACYGSDGTWHWWN